MARVHCAATRAPVRSLAPGSGSYWRNARRDVLSGFKRSRSALGDGAPDVQRILLNVRAPALEP